MVELERNYPFTGYPIEPLTIYELWPGQPIHDWRERERGNLAGIKNRENSNLFTFFYIQAEIRYYASHGPSAFPGTAGFNRGHFFLISAEIFVNIYMLYYYYLTPYFSDPPTRIQILPNRETVCS